MAKLGEAKYDENGQLSYGQKGDQTGQEVAIREVSKTSENWKYVFRAKDMNIRNNLGSAMEQACNNNAIGYAQYKKATDDKYADRYGLWFAMNETGNISKITKKCNCDCSSLVSCCCIICGINVSRYMSTSDEVKILDSTGAFTRICFQNGMELQRGDIMFRQGHTGIIVECDSKSAQKSNSNTSKNNVSHTLEGIKYDAVFDATYYYNRYADLRNAGLKTDAQLWEHFKTYGMKERRQASASFNVDKYASNYIDLRKAFGSNWKSYYRHYCEYGLKEGRKAI